MRTKIGKRIGTVPITLVAVFALAAFLSAGLLLTTGSVQTAEAQSTDCTVMLANANLEDDPPVLGDNNEPVDLSDCYGTAGEAATVAVPGNSSETIKQTVWVYAKGGTIADGMNARLYAPDAAMGDPDDDAVPTPSTTSFSFIELEIDPSTPASTTGAGVDTTAKLAYKNVSVTATSGGEAATLYIYYQDATPFDTDWDHDGDNTTDGVSNKMLEVTADTENDARAIVTISYVRGVDADESDISVDPVPNTITTAIVMVTVRDENEKPIPGFINLTVAGGEDVLFVDSNLKTLRAKLTGGDAMPMVEGLPRTGAFRIAITGDIGGVTLEDNITREGPADSASVSVYEPCVGKACEADDDLIVKPGDTFFIKATAKDMAGNDVTGDSGFAFVGGDDDSQDALDFGGVEEWWNGLSCPQMNDAVSPNPGDTEREPEVGSDNPAAATPSPYCAMFADIAERMDDGDTPDVDESLAKVVIERAFKALQAKGWAVAIVDDEADAGMYSVKATTTNGVSATVTITVSDVANSIMVSCDPEMIDPESGLTDCTITVTDSAGNTPSNLGEKMVNDKPVPDTARVAVRSREVTLIGPNAANEVNLDSSGIGSFTILLREDAPVGSIITINVSSTIGGVLLQGSTMVTYGEAGGTPTVPDGELGTVTDVITGFNRGGALQVSWTKAANASGYIIIAININDVNGDIVTDVTNSGDDENWNIRGLTRGATYDIYVAATASGGRNTLSESVQVTAR
jgi:hypothetical protein